MKKVTVTLSPKQEERLRDVSDALGANQTEVIRRAISVFHKIIVETDSGENTVQLVGKGGKVKKELVLA